MTPRLLLAAAFAAGLAAGPALAETLDDTVPELVVRAGVPDRDAELKTETVRLGDLDLGSSKGARKALTRIRNAAERVCAPRPRKADLDDHADYRACRIEATERAVAELGADAVDQQYRMASR